MKLYIAVRWGNHESSDGPDGEDTQCLIRARDHVEAARLADAILLSMPTACTKGDRSVQPFCHRIIEIGSDGSTFPGVEPQVLMGPWIAYGYEVHHIGYATWKRDGTDKNVWEEETHRAAGRVVKRGSFLYGGSTRCEVEIIQTDFRPGCADNEAPVEDAHGEFYEIRYLWPGQPSRAGGGYCGSLAEAMSAVETTVKEVRWEA